MSSILLCIFFLIALINGEGKQCNVHLYGAKGDGITDDTKAIQAAIDDCNGGTAQADDQVLFPANYNFLSFPIVFKSPYTQIILSGTITANPDWKNWPISADNTTYVSFITNSAYNTDNMKINGHGTINGNGQIWWPLYKNSTLKYHRPHLIKLEHMTGLLVTYIRLVNSPMFHLTMNDIENVIINGINITVTTPGYATAPNTDGIDVGARNVHIFNSFVQNGDDSYVLKGGAYNVLIENSTAQLGLGLDVGTGGNISNAVFRNMLCKETDYGIRLKAKGDTQNGNQSGITFQNITFDRVKKAIDINEFNQSIDVNEGNGVGWVNIKNILFQDIKGTYTDWAGHLNCAQGTPCTNLTFIDVNLKGDGTNQGWQCSDNVYGTAKNVTPTLGCLH
eukprot:306353_1